MRRLLTVILALVLCINLLPIASFAEETSLFSTIYIDQGEIQPYSVIQSGDDLLFSGEDLAAITGYSYSIEGNNAIFSRGIKMLRIDLNANKLYPMEEISKLKPVPLDEKIQLVGNDYYFPSSQILPWMNVSCSEKDGTLCILSDEVSMWDFMGEFKPENFTFSYIKCCQELGVNSKWLKAAAYIQENGVGMVLDAIPVTLDMSYGSYMDYYEIFDDLFKNKESSAYAFKELTENAAEIKSAFDLIDKLGGYDDLPDELKALSAFATALEKISDAADFAVYYMTFQEDNSEKLAMMESITLNRFNFEYPEPMIAAAMQIKNDYSSVWQGLETKLVYLVGEKAFDGLADSATGLMNTALKIVDAPSILSLDWPSAVERIAKYEAISACCHDVIEQSQGSHQSTLRDLRCHAQLYLYSCEQNWRAMAAYAESKEQTEWVEKYLAKAEEAIAWQGKFLAASLAQENDSHEYGEGIAKTQYTEKLISIFSALDYTKGSDASTAPQFIASEMLSNWYFNESDRTGIEIAVLADVTHDGEPELITVVKDEEGISVTGSVYYVDANGTIQQTETLFGSDFHMGGFFGWYLKEAETGYNLIQETFGMWQGYGEVDTTEYYLDTQGNRITVHCANVSSGDSEPVTDEAWEYYVQEGAGILEGASVLYSSAANIASALVPLDESLILEQKIAEIIPLDESYTGEWVNGYIAEEVWDRTLTINSIEDNTINFDLFYYRLADFNNQTATMNSDGTASFAAASGDYSISGELVFGDGVTVHIFDSNHPYVAADSADYARPVVDTTTVGGILPEWETISDSDLIWKYIDLFVGIVQTNENVYEAHVLTSGNETIQYYPDDSSRTWANMEMVQVNSSWLQDSGYSFCVVGYPDKVIFFLCTAGGSTDSGWVYDWDGTLLENYVGQEMPEFILDCIQ